MPGLIALVAAIIVFMLVLKTVFLVGAIGIALLVSMIVYAAAEKLMEIARAR